MKMKNKKLAVLGITLGLSVLSAMPAFAGQWKQDATGWWYQNEDGSYPTSTWKWIDGNNDGIAESYYFNESGYIVVNTSVEGYTVNADGAWTVNGIVQTKQVNSEQQTSGENGGQQNNGNYTDPNTRGTRVPRSTDAGAKFLGYDPEAAARLDLR